MNDKQKYKFNTPIIFIIFNRADTAQGVFNKIKEQQPPTLLVIGDGPRKTKSDDEKKIIETRKIIEQVDWSCKVYTNFSDTNLGCRKRISSGLDWAFNIVDRAIILEDDCLANNSFFRFSQEMLEKYETEEKIMMISGNNNSFMKPLESYYFSNYFHIWGWATWARAWKKNDINLSDWPELKKTDFIKKTFNKKSEQYYWSHYFDLLYSNQVDSWAVPWTYSCYKENGISIAPKYNLISNIGFGKNATHTKTESIFSKTESKELEFPLIHPKRIEINSLFDEKERKIRNKDSKRLPYPLQMLAGKIKWFLKRKIK